LLIIKGRIADVKKIVEKRIENLLKKGVSGEEIINTFL
jgi:hypothetical protein